MEKTLQSWKLILVWRSLRSCSFKNNGLLGIDPKHNHNPLNFVKENTSRNESDCIPICFIYKDRQWARFGLGAVWWPLAEILLPCGLHLLASASASSSPRLPDWVSVWALTKWQAPNFLSFQATAAFQGELHWSSRWTVHLLTSLLRSENLHLLLTHLRPPEPWYRHQPGISPLIFKLPNPWLQTLKLSFSFFFFFHLFLCVSFFQSRIYSVWRFPGSGSDQSCSHWPTPQPQQCQIRAASATYTTSHSNARSLTHLARPGIKPATSWFLVGFVSAVPQRELPPFVFTLQWISPV